MAEMAFEEQNYTEVEESAGPEDSRRRLYHLSAAGFDMTTRRNVLDCGCGAGKDAAIMASEGNFVVGTDISLTALRKARHTSEKHETYVHLIQADSENLPIRENSFDVCYCSWTLHHFPSLVGVLAQLKIALKPGGKIIIIEPNGSNPVVKTSELVENLVRRWLIRTGVDTPNESMHKHTKYTDVLKGLGFTAIQVKALNVPGLPPLPKDSRTLLFLVYCRKFLLSVAWNLLPSPFNGSDVAVTATRT